MTYQQYNENLKNITAEMLEVYDEYKEDIAKLEALIPYFKANNLEEYKIKAIQEKIELVRKLNKDIK